MVVYVGSPVLGWTDRGVWVTVCPPLRGEAEAAQAGEDEGVDQDQAGPPGLPGEEGGRPHLSSWCFVLTDWSQC